ncbi:MAG: acetyl-CoA acetyltransferase [Chloroflexi bacterium]|nr:acetyl-CoA acetyltransferase [Chloroflexota bacterium]
MNRAVNIVGVGWSGFRAISPEVSYKEMTFDAATRAYADAGIDPRNDVQGFVTAAEDYHEGTSIFDEYTPDQLGAVLRPMHTITGDGLHALAAAYMNIASGLMDVVVVEAHSKASNILTLPHITAFAEDPTFERPLALNPLALAGLEMQMLMSAGRFTLEQCAAVVAKNKNNALANPSAVHGAAIGRQAALESELLASPVTRLMTAPHADGAIVFVLADADTSKRLKGKPICIRGIGWANDTPALDSRDWMDTRYARNAAKMAYRVAGIRHPRTEIDFAEVDDTFAHKELQHLEALNLAEPGRAGWWTASGGTERGGEFPVNPSGGALGEGSLLDATGLARALEVVLQLRGDAGGRQLHKAKTGLAFAWRGLPTTSGALAILSA